MVADLFHVGHLTLLERMSKMGDVVVGIPCNWPIKEYTKKIDPIISFEDRLRIVSACKFVDFAFGYANQEDLEKSIEYIKPDLYVRGDDWRDFPGHEKIKKMKIPIKFLPYTMGVSSSGIKAKCSIQC